MSTGIEELPTVQGVFDLVISATLADYNLSESIEMITPVPGTTLVPAFSLRINEDLVPLPEAATLGEKHNIYPGNNRYLSVNLPFVTFDTPADLRVSGNIGINSGNARMHILRDNNGGYFASDAGVYYRTDENSFTVTWFKKSLGNGEPPPPPPPGEDPLPQPGLELADTAQFTYFGDQSFEYRYYRVAGCNQRVNLMLHEGYNIRRVRMSELDAESVGQGIEEYLDCNSDLEGKKIRFTPDGEGSYTATTMKLLELLDSDRDGLVDAREILLGTAVDNDDTDGDGLRDSFELEYGYNPLVDEGAASLDTDEDGLTTEQEQQAGSDPTRFDSDGDRLSDSEEVLTYRTSPIKPDTDDDGLEDWDEINIYKTDPLLKDTDGDRLTDSQEILGEIFNPLLVDTDEDGLTDYFEWQYGQLPPEGDDDRDSLTNLQEQTAGSDPFRFDTDNDGLSDSQEVNQYGTNPALEDTDGGGRSDTDEVIIDGTEPTNADDDITTSSRGLYQLDPEAEPLSFDNFSGRLSMASTFGQNAFGLVIDQESVFRQPEQPPSGPEERPRPVLVVENSVLQEQHYSLFRNYNGLLVSRRIAVNQNTSTVRYLEILYNPGQEPIRTMVGYEADYQDGYYGDGGPGTALVTSHDPEVSLGTEDSYLLMPESDRQPFKVGHLFTDGAQAANNASFSSNNWMSIEYSLDVLPGERRIIAHYTQLTQNLSAAEAKDKLQALLDDPAAAGAFEGMDDDMKADLVNFNACPARDADNRCIAAE